MIKSFAHKGLREFYESGSKKGIQPEHAPKLGRMLDRLDASISPQDMNLPGYRLHPLKGDKQIQKLHNPGNHLRSPLADQFLKRKAVDPIPWSIISVCGHPWRQET